MQTVTCAGCARAGSCPGCRAAFGAFAQAGPAGALVGVARALDGAAPDAHTLGLALQCLQAAAQDLRQPQTLAALQSALQAQKARLAPDCAVCGAPCGRTADYDMALLQAAAGPARSLKAMLLAGLCALAASGPQPQTDSAGFLFQGLFALGEGWGPQWLLPLLARLAAALPPTVPPCLAPAALQALAAQYGTEVE